MIVCTTHRSMMLLFENFNEAPLFRLFLTQEVPPKLILPIRMTSDLREAIRAERKELAEKLPPQINRYYSLLEEIREGEWFYIFPEKMFGGMTEYEIRKFTDLWQLYLRFKNAGLEENLIDECMSRFEKDIETYLAPLEELYDIRCHTSMKSKAYFGEADKSKRICRFCGKKAPEVTFRDVSHAIPLALGNHIFINNYECDCCNHFFGDEIEPHLRQWIAFMITLSGTRGRSGVPELKFEHGAIAQDEEGKLIIAVRKEKSDAGETPEDETEIPTVQLGDGVPYIPSRVYRALVKIALGFVPEERIDKFRPTITWLMNEKQEGRLPKVAYAPFLEPIRNPQPEITLFLRREDRDSDLPYAVASLAMCGMRIVYLLPFCTADSVDYTSDEAYGRFWETFALYSKSPMKWTMEDLSSDRLTTPRLNLHFEQREP